MDDKTALANAITKAIAYQENGGSLDLNNTKSSKDGSMKSIFQFLPATWKQYSTEIFGKEVPLNNDTETYVVQQKVLNWINQGKTTSQIASMWNAGEGNENAYNENWKGTNSSGVEYDTPKYAANVVKYAKEFYAQNSGQDNQSNQNSDQQTVSTQEQPNPVQPPIADTQIAQKQAPLAMQQLIANQSGQSQGNPGLAQQNMA